MFKNKVPTFHAKSIFDIDVSFYKREKIKFVLADLDNTLDSFKTKLPSSKAIELKNKLEKEDIKLVIVSNNTGERVSKYSNALGVNYINSAGKPFASKLLKKLKNANIDKDLSIMIGDQTVTDITCANRAKIKSILTDKIVSEDQWTTKFNRLLDKPIRRYLKKKSLLKDWSD